MIIYQEASDNNRDLCMPEKKKRASKQQKEILGQISLHRSTGRKLFPGPERTFPATK